MRNMPTKEGNANQHPFRRLKTDSNLIGALQADLSGISYSIDESEWTQAKDLISGDLAFTTDGKLLAISSIEIDDREETVYNFEVEDFHTYFVGESGVWVHNDNYSRIRPTLNYFENSDMLFELAVCADEKKSNCIMSYEDSERSIILNKYSGLSHEEIKSLLKEDLIKESSAFVQSQKDIYESEGVTNLFGNLFGGESEESLKMMASQRIKEQLEKFNGETIGNDAITGNPVRVIKGTVIPKDDKQFAEFMNSIQNSFDKEWNDPLSHGLWMKENGPQNKPLDFKNKYSIEGLDAEKNKNRGYSDYVSVNGKLLKTPDIGNFGYGYIGQQMKLTNSDLLSASNYFNVRTHDRNDPNRDTRSIKCGFNNCLNYKPKP
jgi:hypothetical protein